MPARLTVADAAVALHADWDAFQREMASQGPAKAGAAGDAAGKPFGQRFTSALGPDKLTKAFTAAGAAAGVVFTGAVGGAVNFEDQLRTINTVAHLTDDELSGVGKSILDLSKETGKSTDDLTSGFYDLVSAGVPAKDAINVLRDSAKFATGALGTTGQAVDLVTSAMNAYGLAAGDSTKITDVFAQAVADGKVTAAELGESIANIAPIAASAGVSLQEVAAGYAVLTAKGVPAAQAATQMRAAISGLLTPNTQLNEIQKQTGINFAELARTQGLQVALEKLREVTGGNADEFARSLGSIEAYQFALASTGENTEAYKNELQKTTGALTEGGIAQAQYDERMKSAKAQGEKWLANLRAIAIEIGGPFTGVLGPAISLLGEFGNGIFGIFRLSQILGAGGGGLIGRVLGGAWTRVAGSGIIRALVAKAGSAAATAYLTALIAGDGIQTALSGAWKAVTSSSIVQSATGGAGKFLGSTLGKFAAVAFAAVLVVEAINTYNDIKKGLDEQGKAIGKSVGEEIAHGTTQSLEDSKAALQEGIAKLADVKDLGLFSNDARKNLQQQLDSVDAELQKRHEETWQEASIEAGKRAGQGWGTGLKAATPVAATAITTFVGEMRNDLDRAGFKEEAHRQGNLAGAATAAGIREKRSLVDQAWNALLDAIKNAQKPAAERAHLLGELASKELIAGLHSKDPAVRAQAAATKQIIIDRLAELGANTKNIGKSGMEELRKAMRSKDPDIRAAATAIFNAAKKPIAKLPAAGTAAGKQTTANLKDELYRGQGPVGTAAAALATKIARSVMRTILTAGGNVRPPAGGGPVAFDVGSAYIPYDQVAVVHRGERILTAAENAAISAGQATLSSPAAGDGGDTYNFDIDLEGKTEITSAVALARELARIAQTGSFRVAPSAVRR